MSIEKNMKELSKAMKDDSSYAWSWHCNVAMAQYDEMLSSGYINHESIHKVANKGAARFMKIVFGVDTSECKEYKAIAENDPDIKNLLLQVKLEMLHSNRYYTNHEKENILKKIDELFEGKTGSTCQMATE